VWGTDKTAVQIGDLTTSGSRQYLQDMSAINLKVNGKIHAVDVDPTTPLLYVLSDDLALNGPKFGCGLGQCGACTVIVKGQAIRSCITPVKSVEGAEITTLEGIGTIDKPHPLQTAFIEEQAAQCGFCINGVIMTAKAFLDKNPKATPLEIQRALSGVLCRCFTHTRMLHAIEKARQVGYYFRRV
jgi:nicotinate dehydrogenase subunit A